MLESLPSGLLAVFLHPETPGSLPGPEGHRERAPPAGQRGICIKLCQLISMDRQDSGHSDSKEVPSCHKIPITSEILWVQLAAIQNRGATASVAVLNGHT